MSKHTAGPWFVGAQNDALFIYDTAPSPEITSIQPKDAVVVIAAVAMLQHEIADANARLIAAAPDLLEACKSVRDFCDDPNGSESPESLAAGLARILPSLRAAVKKAEGAQ